MKQTVCASAPGKIIISGEHFVVHGSYAVAAAINRRVKVSIYDTDGKSCIVAGNRMSELESQDGNFSVVKSVVKSAFEKYGERARIKIEVTSGIPKGSGLGSSAAVSVATAAATLKFLGMRTDPANILDMALSGERQIHGTPSGIDLEASLQGGVILFSRKTGGHSIPINESIQFLIIFSGMARRTSELIAKVTKRKQVYPHFFEHLTEANSLLSLEVARAIGSGDLNRLSALMNTAQTCLFWAGVSTSLTDSLIEEVLKCGSLAAKITGAGGGGSIVALPRQELADSILKSMTGKYPEAFLVTIPQDGLRWEN